MAAEYRSYLAANVLSEERVITYRLLSRALKVHVNTSKQMLFEFHRQQNVKKPGTVHATYLVAGTKRKTATTTTNGIVARDGDDEHMQSNPFMSSPAPNLEESFEDSPVLSISLVREEDLEELQSQYEIVTSIHVYSLAPHPVKDLRGLSDAAREITEEDANQDPPKLAGTYGTISNRAVRRRTGPRPPPPIPSEAATAPAKASDIPSKQIDVIEGKHVPTPKTRPEVKGSQEKRNTKANPPQLKRDSSSIFKSFAKAKPPLKQEGTDSSAGASGLDSAPPSGLEDEVMKDTSEDDEENYILPPQASSIRHMETERKSRKDREAALKKMMEEENDSDDENEESDIIPENLRSQGSRNSPGSQPAEEAIQVLDGRRRGRRRIMKKKTVKDDEGYLVTREEPAWESFSEDEPVKTKPKPPSSLPPGSDKSRKGLDKVGQGSIMSFFGKK